MIGRGGRTASTTCPSPRTAPGSATPDGGSCVGANPAARRSGPSGRTATRHAGSPAARSPTSPTGTPAQRRSRRLTIRLAATVRGGSAIRCAPLRSIIGGTHDPAANRPGPAVSLADPEQRPAGSSVSLVAHAQATVVRLLVTTDGFACCAQSGIRRRRRCACVSSDGELLEAGRRSRAPRICTHPTIVATPFARAFDLLSRTTSRLETTPPCRYIPA
jgi:hypothetical protein